MPLIETSGLTKRYGRVTALDGLTLDIEPGIIGLVGPNGAGKSTLIKILLGLVDATSGTAEVLGIDAAREGLRVREIVGYMPEHDCLPPDQSATNFVIHMARMSGIPPSAARERASEVLRHVGLFEERYRHMGGYSTGMKQRVKLAQALAHDPRLLFLDEPTNGLDPQGRDEMLDLVERTGHEFGISIVMSSHLLTEIERVCDGLIVVDEGKLMRTGRIAELTDETSRARRGGGVGRRPPRRDAHRARPRRARARSRGRSRGRRRLRRRARHHPRRGRDARPAAHPA